MTCDDAGRLWARMLAEDLGREEEKSFEDHLSDCPSCRERQAARERSLARFDALPRSDPPPAVWAEIERKIGLEMTAPPRAPARRWWLPLWGAGVAAAVLAVVVLHPAGPAFEPGQVVESGDVEVALAIPGLTLAPQGRVRMPAFAGDAVHLEAGTLMVDRAEGIRVEAGGATVALREGPIAISRTSALEVEIRAAGGSALLRGEDGGLPIPAGTWIGLVRGRAVGRPLPLKDYEAFVLTRREARKTGRRGGEDAAGTREELVRLGDPRPLAALALGHWESELKLSDAAAEAVGAALLETFVGGAQAGLPANWFFRDFEDREADELREALMGRLRGILTGEQLEAARELIDGED